MRIVMMIVMAALLSTGCVTKKFDNFVTQPTSFVGFGIDNAWMWVDAGDFGDELVKNKVNITHIEVFGCGPDKNTWPSQPVDSNRGYWMESSRWSTVKSHLDTFLDAMKKRKVTVGVTITGWNYRGGCPDPANGNKPSTICSVRFDNNWFGNVVNYFKNRGTEGIILCASAEPYGGKNTECYSKFDQWTAILNANWAGMKAWNKGTRPRSAPAGYFVEYHSQSQNDFPPAGAYELTDSPVGGTLYKPGAAETARVDPAKVIPYIKSLKAKGVGFILYGYPFNGWNIDKDGIKAVGQGGQ